MKHISAIFLGTASFCSSAQVVFDLPSALPPLGTHVAMLWVGPPPSLATSGTGVVWDLSSLNSAVSERTYTDAIPSTTPSAADFPNATHAHAEIINGMSSWYYYRLVGDSLWLEGARFQDGSLFTCTEPNLFMVFPTSIGDLAESNTTCSVGGGPLYTVNQGLQPVATGSIIYSGGTITDVVLSRAYYYGSPAEYYFHRAGDVLQSIGRYDPGTIELWVPGITTGVEEQSGDRLTAYPTLASEELFVELPNGVDQAQCTLLDAAGRTVNAQELRAVGGRLRVDLSKVTTGHYLLRVVGNGFGGHARVIVAR